MRKSDFKRSGRRAFALVVVLPFAIACSRGAESVPQPAVDVATAIVAEGVDPAHAALLIVRMEDGAEWSSGGTRIEHRFSPASTSKIPHTLIALETGYAASPEHAFKWDGVERTFDFWNRDHTLKTAYQFSAVWAFQRLTSDLGYETMKTRLKKLDYGDANTGGPDDLTSYWLQGPLAISAREQTVFLSKLIREALPLSAETYRMGKQIMLEAEGDDWALYAKTGWGSDGDNPDIGWYVGWVEDRSGEQPQNWIFAFNMEMLDESSQAKRRKVVRSALALLGVADD